MYVCPGRKAQTEQEMATQWGEQTPALQEQEVHCHRKRSLLLGNGGSGKPVDLGQRDPQEYLTASSASGARGQVAESFFREYSQ